MTQGKLSAAQMRAIEALLTHATITDAATAAKVGRRTLTRWLAEDAPFCAELRRREGEVLQGVTRRLSTLAAASLDVLHDVLTGDEQQPGHKLKAADTVLSKLAPMKELVDFEQRLAALEAAQHETQQTTNRT
jgi:hypothetical protein